MDWKRLAETVLARRVQMGFATRESLARHAGLSGRLLGDIENARRSSYDKATLIKLENALQWAPGSVDAVLDGRDPRSPDAPAPGPGLPAVEDITRYDLPPAVRASLEATAVEKHNLIDVDVVNAAVNLRHQIHGLGFRPANDLEARMLVYKCSRKRLREPAWRLVLGMAEQDTLMIGLPPGRPAASLAEVHWAETHTQDYDSLIMVAVFTSQARVEQRDPSWTALPTNARELVKALPDHVAGLVLNPGSPLTLTISPESLQSALAVIDGVDTLDESGVALEGDD